MLDRTSFMHRPAVSNLTQTHTHTTECRAANPNYVWMTFNNCYDECYCGLACTSTTYEEFSDLFALDWVRGGWFGPNNGLRFHLTHFLSHACEQQACPL